MTALTKTLKRIGSGALLAGLLAAAAHGQVGPSSADAFDIPEDVSILGPSDPNVRKATVKVNGTVITGTEVDQRVALIIASNEAQPSPEELERLRLQVFRNLIDETLQIQEAKAQEITVDPKEIDASFTRVARNYEQTPDQFRAQLRRIGSSERTIRRQIEGELAWNRLLRRRGEVNVSEAEAKEVIDRITRARMLEDVARDIDEDELNRHLAGSYGIFSGEPRGWATIVFNPRAARWVADEHWHSQQQGRWLADGSYELKVPFSSSRELLMDVLHYGADATIVEPASMREKARSLLALALSNYDR